MLKLPFFIIILLDPHFGIFICFKILKNRALKMFQKLKKMIFLYAFGIHKAKGYRHVSDNLSMLRPSQVNKS